MLKVTDVTAVKHGSCSRADIVVVFGWRFKTCNRGRIVSLKCVEGCVGKLRGVVRSATNSQRVNFILTALIS